MKKPQYVIILIALGICGLLVWAFSDRFSKSWMVSQVPPPRLQAPLITTTLVSTTALQGLTVQFHANRASYILGEPVVITVTAQNQTAAPLIFNDGFQLIAGLISVQIAKNGGDFLDYSGPFPVASQEFITGTLAPGASRTLSFSILANRPSTPEVLPYFYAFATPGAYQLRAVLHHIIPHETLISAPIAIEMFAPQGIDAQIWRLLQTEDAADFLQNGSARNPELIAADFAAILAIYPDNFYAPAMRAAIMTYQTTQPQNGDALQAAQRIAPLTLLSVNEQLFLARSTAEGGANGANLSNKDILADVIGLTNKWTDAWNERDLDRYAGSYSYHNYIRQDWETGPGNRPYEKLRKRMETLFAENGTLKVEIIGFTVDSNEITADVVGRFERGSKNYAFDKMRFVLDDDGVWRIYSPGY